MNIKNIFRRKTDNKEYPKLKIDLWEVCLLDAIKVLVVAFIIVSAFLVILGVSGGITLEDVHTFIYGRYILALIHADYVICLLLILTTVASYIVLKIQQRLREEWANSHDKQTTGWFTDQATTQQRQQFDYELRGLCSTCTKGETEKLIQWLLQKEEEGLIILPKVTKKVHSFLVENYQLNISYQSFNEHMPSKKK